MAQDGAVLSGRSLTIRDAVTDDFGQLRELLLEGYREFSTRIPGVFDAYIADILDVERRAAEAELLVAEADALVVGTVTYYPDASDQGLGWPGGWAGVRTLAVSPRARGLGIGRALMDECLRRARAQRAPAIGLHTAEFMTVAVGIYDSVGFERASVFDFEPPGQDAADAVEPLRLIGYLKLLPGR